MKTHLLSYLTIPVCLLGAGSASAGEGAISSIQQLGYVGGRVAPSAKAEGATVTHNQVIQLIAPVMEANFQKVQVERPKELEGKIESIRRAAPKSEKPNPPVVIQAVLGTVYEDGSQDVQVSVVPSVTGKNLNVRVDAGEGVSISTNQAWSSGAVEGLGSAKNVRLRVAGANQWRLNVFTTIELADGVSQTASAGFILNAKGVSAKPVDVVPSNTKETIDSKGKKVLEMKAAEF